jgi:hypothetical protein
MKQLLQNTNSNSIPGLSDEKFKGLELQVVQSQKDIKALSELMQKSYNLQLAGGEMSDIDWKDLPSYIKKQFTGMFKFTLYKIAFAPITVPYKIGMNLVVNPMIYFMDHSFHYLKYIWGGIMFAFVIGNVAYIVYNNDFTYVNNFMKNYVGEYMYQYSTIIIDNIPLPTFDKMHIGLQHIWEDFFKKTFGFIISYFETMYGYGRYMVCMYLLN